MAQLMIFRRAVVPSDTEYGDDINVSSPGKSTVSENLSEQILTGSLLYQSSVKFEPGSTRVYLNGLYMTNGEDYSEIGSNKILFDEEHAGSIIDDMSVISVVYTVK